MKTLEDMVAVRPRADFWTLQGAAAKAGVETSLQALEDALEVSGCDRMLDRIAAIQRFLTQAGLELAPGLEEGSLTSVRVLRFCGISSAVGPDDLLRTIQLGESADREFKSSFLYDHKKAQENINAATLKSDAVAHSTLKTIAAFINGSGGTLLVGVSDDGGIVGIEFDYPYTKKPDADAWALALRDRVQSSFHTGRSINNYIDIDFTTIDLKTAARVRVAGRADLCYLKDQDGKYYVYRRQGNRTVKVETWEIEELVRLRDSTAQGTRRS